MSKLFVPQRVLHAILNLAIQGVTVRELARRLTIPLSTAQLAVNTLLQSGQLYETRSTKKTLYHTIRTFVNRLAQATEPAAYQQVMQHLTKHRNRKFTLKELAQQLGLTVPETSNMLNLGLGQNTVTKSHVGALELYGLN